MSIDKINGSVRISNALSTNRDGTKLMLSAFKPVEFDIVAKKGEDEFGFLLVNEYLDIYIDALSDTIDGDVFERLIGVIFERWGKAGCNHHKRPNTSYQRALECLAETFQGITINADYETSSFVGNHSGGRTLLIAHEPVPFHITIADKPLDEDDDGVTLRAENKALDIICFGSDAISIRQEIEQWVIHDYYAYTRADDASLTEDALELKKTYERLIERVIPL